jgi:hypothetical protein
MRECVLLESDFLIHVAWCPNGIPACSDGPSTVSAKQYSNNCVQLPSTISAKQYSSNSVQWPSTISANQYSSNSSG